MLKSITRHYLKRISPPWVTDAGMKRHGIRNLMKWGKRYNKWVYAARSRRHDEAYQQREELLRENAGGDYKCSSLIRDGFALDKSRSLPYLEELLRETDEIIAARGGREHGDIQQPYLRSLLFPGDLERYPSLVNFVTSSEILSAVMEYMKTVPVLAKTRPPGVRLMESNAALDPDAFGPNRTSQLYHLDIHDTPLVYVLVAAQDITPTSGPWTFLPDSVSSRVSEAIRYREAGENYRISDEEIYNNVDPSEAIEFTCPKGTVLFIDSSRCFHFGSRRSNPPRYQLMYAYTSVCRSDFSETFMRSHSFPVGENPSRLRRLVCE